MAVKKIYCVESSAVLAYLLKESHANQMARFLEEAELVLSSVLCVLEVERALCRFDQQKLITSMDKHRLKNAFSNMINEWEKMEVNQIVQKRVVELFPVEPIRTLDAIHLATALEFVKIYPELQVLSLDQRILANLAPLGLTTPLQI